MLDAVSVACLTMAVISLVVMEVLRVAGSSTAPGPTLDPGRGVAHGSPPRAPGDQRVSPRSGR